MTSKVLKDQEVSIETLIDTTEAMLNVLEKKGIDSVMLSRTKEFTVLIHFLKAIIDGELGIPNELTGRIKDGVEPFNVDNSYKHKLH